MVKHIAFTMYPVRNMARARKFYEKGLGLKMTKNFDDAWVEYHLGNGAFAITTMASGVKPSADRGGSITFEVKNVDAAVKRLRGVKAKIKVPAFDTPVCRMAFLKDSEGNVLGVHAKKTR
ncbi:MAG: VOC family protein [Elusimicrobia bacterium]|nr:VOC family protein [Elusimicrobiota bacterium]